MKSLADPREIEALRARLARIRPDARRRWGVMTAHQMVCHLADALRMFTGEKPTAPRTGPLQRTVVKWIALRVPLPWPPGIPTSIELDARGGGTPAGDFAADLAITIALLEHVATQPGGTLPHPIFGALTRDEWLRWGWLHTDHHLRQFGL